MTEILGVTNEGNSIWYVSGSTHMLIKLSAEDFSVQKRILIEKPSCDLIPFSDGILYQEQLIWAPWNMLGILCFDRNISNFHFIEIAKTKSGAYFFHRILVMEERAFFIPFHYHALVEMDLKSKRISYHKEPVERVRFGKNNVEHYFKEAEWLNQEIMLLPFYNGNKIIFYNINTKKTTVYNLEKEDVCLQKCIYSENKIFVLPRNENRIYVYDLKFQKITTISLGKYYSKVIDRNSLLADSLFADMIDCDSYLLVIQSQWDYSYIIDKFTYNVKCINLCIPFNDETKEIWTVKKISSEYVIISGLYDTKWIGRYDIRCKKIDWYRLPTKLNNIFSQYPKWKNILKEESNTNLRDYLGEIIDLKIDIEKR